MTSIFPRPEAPPPSAGRLRGSGIRSLSGAVFLQAALLIPPPARALAARPYTPTRDGFAAELMAERDYFRAVTVYKELAYFSGDDSARNLYAAKIATAYRLAGKYELAIETLEGRLKSGTLDGPGKDAFYLQAALNNMHLGSWTGADGYLGSIPAEAMGPEALAARGCFFGLQEGWPEAAAAFAAARKSLAAAPAWKPAGSGLDSMPKADAEAGLDGLVRWAEAGPALPHKIPELAVALSALVPGSGQMYCGHPIDGLQAFAFTVGSCLATYGLYRFDARQHDGYGWAWASASFTGLLYVANLYGAGRTAAYRNVRQSELHRAKMWKLAEALGL